MAVQMGVQVRPSAGLSATTVLHLAVATAQAVVQVGVQAQPSAGLSATAVQVDVQAQPSAGLPTTTVLLPAAASAQVDVQVGVQAAPPVLVQASASQQPAGAMMRAGLPARGLGVPPPGDGGQHPTHALAAGAEVDQRGRYPVGPRAWGVRRGRRDHHVLHVGCRGLDGLRLCHGDCHVHLDPMQNRRRQQLLRQAPRRPR